MIRTLEALFLESLLSWAFEPSRLHNPPKPHGSYSTNMMSTLGVYMGNIAVAVWATAAYA